MKQKRPELTLTCEYLNAPLGIQNQSPRFGWTLPCGFASQKSYSLSVFDDVTNDCVWQTGVQVSNRNYAVEYRGQLLKSRTIYRWEVTVELTDGTVLQAESRFETGIFHAEEWLGQWLQAPAPECGKSPQFRKNFYLDKLPQRSRIYICGLGYYELYLNGRKVGDRVLEPGWTDYNKRVLYSVYDVSEYLNAGENCIGVCLGDGWYSALHEGFMHLMGSYPSWNSTPKFICELCTWDDGRMARPVLTNVDDPWLCCESPIVSNSLYDGEVYDARLENEGWNTPVYQPDHAWKVAEQAAAPKGKLVAQIMPPIKEKKTYRPSYITLDKDNSVIVDFGQNLAGWVNIRVRGQAGQKITMHFGEMLDHNGSVCQDNLRDAKARDCYILKGDEYETYTPRFTYHGFRYMQIYMDPGVLVYEVTAVAVHTDVEQTGNFCCSNDLLNRIQKAILVTETNNLHSVPTDCPQRDERLGWVNDMTVRFEETMFNYDVALLFEKWLDDIADAQDSVTGSIPDTAPYFYGSYEAMHVSSVYVLLPWYMYLFYGDDQPLRKHYEGMCRYVRHKLEIRDAQGLIPEHFYGEWAAPMTESVMGFAYNALPSKIPPQLVTTGYLYYDCVMMQKIATELGWHDDAKAFGEEAKVLADAINKKFFNVQKGYYEPNVQGSNLFPLYLGIVPDGHKQAVLGNLCENLKQSDYHGTTGNQLTKYLYEVLRREELHKEAFKIASSETYPSIGYMLANGATTIWERWEHLTGNNMNSHNHPMLGAFTVWFYKALAGIMDEEGLTNEIHLKPAVVFELEFACASCRTAGGILESAWHKQGNQVVFDVTVPWNTCVHLEVPKTMKMIDEKQSYLTSGKHQVVCQMLPTE